MSMRKKRRFRVPKISQPKATPLSSSRCLDEYVPEPSIKKNEAKNKTIEDVLTLATNVSQEEIKRSQEAHQYLQQNFHEEMKELCDGTSKTLMATLPIRKLLRYPDKPTGDTINYKNDSLGFWASGLKLSVLPAKTKEEQDTRNLIEMIFAMSTLHFSSFLDPRLIEIAKKAKGELLYRTQIDAMKDLLRALVIKVSSVMKKNTEEEFRKYLKEKIARYEESLFKS